MKDVEASQGDNHQQDVAHVLGTMGLPHAVNHTTIDGLFCADILISGHSVLIQVDGPHHWTCNTGQPIGKTCCGLIVLPTLLRMAKPCCSLKLLFSATVINCIKSTFMAVLQALPSAGTSFYMPGDGLC